MSMIILLIIYDGSTSTDHHFTFLTFNGKTRQSFIFQGLFPFDTRIKFFLGLLKLILDQPEILFILCSPNMLFQDSLIQLPSFIF